ncbi:MAG: hypothetical protein ACI392_07580 [Paludibacteraceae bacterium]
MKRSFLFCVVAAWCGLCAAQAPDAMTFQAVVRTAQGAVAANRTVTVQATILQGSADGTTVYSENFSGKTNANGLVTLKIGGGTPTIGDFATIDWAHGPYFLTIAVDPDGGFSFTTQSTTQLLSVPYALYANTAAKLSEPVSYNDLVDVPAYGGGGFSGNYNDLTNTPELAAVATTGEYSDLQGTPTLATVATSGNYSDLNGKPVFATVATTGKYDDLQDKPTLANVATSGSYNDLTNAPALAKVATSGSYNDLTDRPSLSADGTFSGDYSDLSGRPNIKDSIRVYGFSGNYSDLTNSPDLAVVATSGSYNDLTDKPALATVATSGDYSDLNGKPTLATVATTGKYDDLQDKPTLANVATSGSYNDLTNAPALAKVATSGSYNDLTDKPTLSENGSFSGSYNDLSDKPNLQDSIAKYAPDAGSKPVWDDISGRPQGSAEGDILYWSESQWKTLPLGEEGQFLAIADGQLAWVEPDWANTTATTYKVGDIYFNAAGEAEGIVCELSTVGRFAKIVGLTDFASVQWDPLAVDGCWNDGYTGTLPTETKSTSQNNGLTNMTTIKNISNWGAAYPAFKTCATAGDSWYLPSQKEMLNIVANVDVLNTQLNSIPGATAISQSVYWTSTESGRDFAYAVTAKDYSTTSGGETFTVTKGNAFDDAKATKYGVRPMRRLSWAETTSKDENQISYKPGDLYIVGGDTLGIVYTTNTGGIHGYAITLAEYKLAWCTVDTDSIGANSMADGSANTQKMAAQADPSKYPLLQQAQTIGAGWYIPSADEWMSIRNRLTDINAYITNQRPTATLLNTAGIYWSSTEANKANAYTFNMDEDNTASTAKTEQKLIRYLIAF